MRIQLGYDISFETLSAVPMIAVLRVHPSRAADLESPDKLRTSPAVPVRSYRDCFGNICCRFVAPAGIVRLHSSAVIADPGHPDPVELGARQNSISELPAETLQFLLPSRYCEVDRLSDRALKLFGQTEPGWNRVQAICSWVHNAVTFGYHLARPTKTALDVLNECGGVCRDFQHLAITFCRAMGIPARYTTGYLGDIGVPPNPSPMDFSAWFEVYLADRWWAFDARHNMPRIGRIPIASGRDAADVAITTAFGSAILKTFSVITEEMPAGMAAG